MQEAKVFLHELGNKPITNLATGITASVSKRGRGKMISSVSRRLSRQNGYTEAEHVLAAVNVENLFRNAVLSEVDDDKNSEIESIKIFSSLLIINNKPAIACFTVKETNNAGHKVYTVQLLALKKPAGSLPRSAEKRSSATAGFVDINISQLAKKFNNTSKVVDENGEPMVVYHGTKRGMFADRFNTFEGNGKAIWHSSSEEYAKLYFSEKKWNERGDIYTDFLS